MLVNVAFCLALYVCVSYDPQNKMQYIFEHHYPDGLSCGDAVHLLRDAVRLLNIIYNNLFLQILNNGRLCFLFSFDNYI
jgi:hypothetical protein